VLFNEGWKFHKGDTTNAENTDFNDRDWRSLNLPHDWSIEGPFSPEWASGTAFLPAGIGWYRKIFRIPAQSKNKKVFIYFAGIYNNSEVWINGHYLGRRPNGFISFEYELTPYLHFGGNNVLAVKADHSQFADSRWYTGSGIYRNVYLITTAPVHIALWGVGFTTPEVSSTQARVRVNVTVTNPLSHAADITVQCKLLDVGGKTVATANKKLSVKGSGSSVAGVEFKVRNPQLWSVEHPALHDLQVSVISNGKQTDQWRGKTGIRTIRFDPDSGFFLNGKNMKLKGVCLHDDAGALGVAVPEEVWYRRLKLLKEAGCNAVRMSHNPHAEYLYGLCDTLGLLVMDEAFDEWEVGKNKWIRGWNVGKPGKDGYHEYFTNWYERDLRDMVLRDRNHPSIILWSIGNEIDYPNDPYSDPVLSTGRNPQIYGRGYLPDHPPAKRLGEISRLLVDVVKKYDTTRPVTAALAGVVMSNKTTFPENLDVVGYNYQEYRYPEDHKNYPGRVIYGSENGLDPGAWDAVDSNAFIAGQFLWTGIDYLGEARRWPLHASGSGLLDLAGFPKPAYYFRQSIWSDRPMIHLLTADAPKESGDVSGNQSGRSAKPDWNYRRGDRVRVSCYTNCSEAELFLNGHSFGKKKLSDFKNGVIYWDLDYQPGELLVKGKAKNGSAVSDRLKAYGQPYAIIAGIAEPSRSNASGLRQIAIRVVDKNGNPVYEADNEITVSVSGPATLTGLENGSLDSREDYKSNSRKLLKGKLLAYIQAENKPGAIKITVQSPGLASKVLSIP
jgi:beta-galactosidase/beta-glucuronidase